MAGNIMAGNIRTAIVQCRVDKTPEVAGAQLATILRYLPGNYTARIDGSHIVIQGIDDDVRTLDGYVIPRLASALITAREVTDSDEKATYVDPAPVNPVPPKRGYPTGAHDVSDRVLEMWRKNHS